MGGRGRRERGDGRRGETVIGRGIGWWRGREKQNARVSLATPVGMA